MNYQGGNTTVAEGPFCFSLGARRANGPIQRTDLMIQTAHLVAQAGERTEGEMRLDAYQIVEGCPNGGILNALFFDPRGVEEQRGCSLNISEIDGLLIRSQQIQQRLWVVCHGITYLFLSIKLPVQGCAKL